MLDMVTKRPLRLFAVGTRLFLFVVRATLALRSTGDLQLSWFRMAPIFQVTGTAAVCWAEKRIGEQFRLPISLWLCAVIHLSVDSLLMGSSPEVSFALAAYLFAMDCMLQARIRSTLLGMAVSIAVTEAWGLVPLAAFVAANYISEPPAAGEKVIRWLETVACAFPGFLISASPLQVALPSPFGVSDSLLAFFDKNAPLILVAMYSISWVLGDVMLSLISGLLVNWRVAMADTDVIKVYDSNHSVAMALCLALGGLIVDLGNGRTAVTPLLLVTVATLIAVVWGRGQRSTYPRLVRMAIISPLGVALVLAAIRLRGTWIYYLLPLSYLSDLAKNPTVCSDIDLLLTKDLFSVPGSLCEFILSTDPDGEFVQKIEIALTSLNFGNPTPLFLRKLVAR